MCPTPGCPWVGSRSGRSKHYKKCKEKNEAPAETPAQTATSGPGPSQEQPGVGHRGHISVNVRTQSGDSYAGSLPLVNSGRLMNRPIHESTRIDQSETLESETDFGMTDDSQDPDWVPFN